MLTVILYGELRARYGRRYVLDVRTPGEAIHALCVQLHGLRQYFITNATKSFLVRGNHDYTAEELHHPQSTGILKIVPLIQGTGATGRIIAGVALAVAGGLMMYFGGPLVGSIGLKVAALGVAVALGGVAELLAPRPKGAATPEKADNTPSLAFNGAVNTMGQGGPVPLGYGRLLVGSQVISVGFSTNNEVVVR